MFSGMYFEMAATVAAHLISGAYIKYIPDDQRGKFLEDLRESICDTARRAATEVREKLREELREELWEQILENEFGRKPSPN